ncbi:alpha/beta-hydrolase [Rhizopus microsporus]|uniref:Alpha/beta-hydrolase n=1 Tax=Rhizopus microsporus TaxID=58291 RepID=A0A1X0S8N3_RHIZD|nr:alpha/beta-hydrolase [Rhizopus microsporus]
MPLISRTLVRISNRLRPIVQTVSKNRVLGPAINLVVRCHFFVIFVVLLMSDQLIRKLLNPFIPQHATKKHLSVINVGDAKFFRLGNHHRHDPPKSSKSFETEKGFKRPEYSLSMAHTLCVASKLAYEDVDVVKHELEQAGFDIVSSFKPIGYKNVCAYVVEKEGDILLVFRGTNPLNIQNYVTNIDAGLTEIFSADTPMGKVHKGFWDAMGATTTTHVQEEETRIHLELSHTSLLQSIASAVKATLQIMRMVSFNIFQNVVDPIDASWVSTSEVRYHSLYSQAETWIMRVMQERSETRKRLFITGHSLGGALATVFLAKMIQSKSPLIPYFAGLYTYGQPNIGDEAFGRSFGPEITYVVPRIPYWYSPPPGTLVFIDAAYKITIYPPDPNTNQPVPVRPISYLHLSGILNRHVIGRLKQETSVRILFRLLLPFFINDHFPSDYSDALLSGDVEWIVVGENEGGNEEKDEKMRRYHV